MKCEEFKQKLLEEPASDDPQLKAHRRQCPPCQAFYEQTQRMEQQLAQAFEQDIDEDFLDQLQLQLAADARQAKRRRWLQWGLAASLLLISVAGLLVVNHYQHRNLNEFVIAHIENEIDQLDNTLPVNQLELDTYLAQFNSAYLKVLDEVTYVEKCRMRTGYGLHLVFTGQNGPVTLLLMPNEPLEKWLDISDTRFQGRVYALERGSMALIGEPGEPIEMLAEKIRMAQQQALLF